MILWLNPSAGLSGDMLLGALLDLGAPLDEVRDAVATTGLTGWQLETERAAGALRAVVRVEDGTAETHRAAELLERVGNASPEAVATLAVGAVSAIAQAKSAIDGCVPAEVDLHEIGDMDTVVCVVGVAAAFHALGVSQVYCAPVAMGSGEVRTRQGVLFVPTPVTLALLAGAQLRGIDLAEETVTPTGAALLGAMGAQYGPLPAMRLERTGYGAGAKVFPDRSNVLQAVLGVRVPAAGARELNLLETNLDDVTGELLGDLVAHLLDDGALDAWTSAAVMKKGRPAHLVHVLCEPVDAPRLQEKLFVESGTLGIRTSTVMRTALPRTTVTVEVDGHPVRVKAGPHGAKPEHDDVVYAAAASGLPARDIAARALDAFRNR